MINEDLLLQYKWTTNIYNQYINYLKKLGNTKLAKFNSKIINTNQKILGINTPTLRKIAKIISKGNIESFLTVSNNQYFEETLIQGFIIGYIIEKETFIEHFHKFILKIDNWATCDMCVSSFKIMKNVNFYPLAKELSLQNNEFISRVGIVIILEHYINNENINDILTLTTKIKSNYYYTNMALSWLISICFIKFRTNTLELIKQKKLPVFVQNKTISKINDSYRVNKEEKELVKQFLC